MSNKTTPPLRGTPPAEGNDSPSPKGWQAKPDGVVPRLRFPAFQAAGEWEAKLLGAVCEMQAGKFVAASEISERQSEGLYPCFGGNGLRGYTKTFNQSGRYSLIGRQGALCGNVNLVEGNFYATEHAVVTTPKPGNRTDWLFYNLCLLNLNRFATGQAQPGLSIDVLEKVNCAVPNDEEEQQKIADCLAALDERITLEAQKLDTLKTHKKGLMQQLFPAEGETLPKLRFPEFRDAGEWHSCQLGEITQFSSGGTPSKDVAKYWGGSIPWISASSMYEANINKSELNVTALAIGNGTRIAKKGSLLILVRGSMLFNRVPIGIATIDVAFNQDVKALAISDGVSGIFLLYQLISFESRISINETGIGAGKIETDDLKHLIAFVPSIEEQEAIADCLSSLDDLLTAQTQKLTALKTHKKGLMQQLFPSMG